MLHLELESIRFIELRRRLLELYPDINDQTLADTLEGATNLREALAALIRSSLDDECMAKALKERIEVMKGRLARLEARASQKRQLAIETLEATNQRKLAEADFTASLRLGPPSVEIVNETELPLDFLLPQPAKPDKRSILAALTAGHNVPGALLAQPKISLSIRSQ